MKDIYHLLGTGHNIYVLERMGFVKQKSTTKVKISVKDLEELKEQLC